MENLYFADEVQNTCPANFERPAGYPENLFAANISEGYRLIESRERKFVFVPACVAGSATASSVPVLDIPERAGQKLDTYLQYTLEIDHAAIDRMKGLLLGLSVLPSSYFNFQKVSFDQQLSFYLPAYPPELFYSPSIGRFKHTTVDPETLQALINRAVHQTGSRGHGFDRLAHELEALAGDEFRQSDASYTAAPLIQGAGTLPPAPYWHIDTTDIFNASFGVNMVNFWQGSRTIYCDTGYNVPQEDVIKSAEELTTSFESRHQDKKLLSLNFSHPVLWGPIRDSIGQMFRVNNVSIYDYIANHTSPELKQALQDYEDYVYYNKSTLEITIDDQANDQIVDYLKTTQLNEICTLMGGAVYATPPGHLSMHAMSNDYRSAALHRSPTPGYQEAEARFGVVIFRFAKEAIGQDETLSDR
jgi:hypothetical protein